jgi:AbrB family looped-hinge helix DNA binding protein
MDMSVKVAKKTEVYTTTMSSRGQVVLPSSVRRRLGLRKGTRIHIVFGEDSEGSIKLQPLHAEAIRKVRGSMPAAAEALDFLQQERRRDRERGC